jgi:hypothetical protein
LLKPIAPRSDIAEHGRIYNFLPEAASFGLSIGYTFPETNVSLSVISQSAVRQPDGVELLQLTLSAKSAPLSSASEDLEAALDRCHDTVIRGFDDITTDVAHLNWRKR